jgi:hypothetical protein
VKCTGRRRGQGGGVLREFSTEIPMQKSRATKRNRILGEESMISSPLQTPAEEHAEASSKAVEWSAEIKSQIQNESIQRR